MTRYVGVDLYRRRSVIVVLGWGRHRVVDDPDRQMTRCRWDPGRSRGGIQAVAPDMAVRSPRQGQGRAAAGVTGWLV